jgi:xylan 1,4-beta-xylosidase
MATYTVGAPKGSPKQFDIDVSHLANNAHATVWRLDETHGNAIAAFDKMGRPDTPSREQIAQLRAAGKMAAPETIDVRNGKLNLTVPVQGLVVVELH